MSVVTPVLFALLRPEEIQANASNRFSLATSSVNCSIKQREGSMNYNLLYCEFLNCTKVANSVAN